MFRRLSNCHSCNLRSHGESIGQDALRQGSTLAADAGAALLPLPVVICRLRARLVRKPEPCAGSTLVGMPSLTYDGTRRYGPFGTTP
jgi:hypothetical protein